MGLQRQQDIERPLDEAWIARVERSCLYVACHCGRLLRQHERRSTRLFAPLAENPEPSFTG
jgi:hypothetical protein